jgi:hypothetical protein
MSEDFYPRRALRVDRIYFSVHDQQYFFTPDGVGVIWFDTYLEAHNETGIRGPVTHIHQRLED